MNSVSEPQKLKTDALIKIALVQTLNKRPETSNIVRIFSRFFSEIQILALTIRNLFEYAKPDSDSLSIFTNDFTKILSLKL